MAITTKGLIDILPFEDAFRTELKSKWDSMSEDQKNAIAQRLWDTYADIYQERFDANADGELMEIADGEKTGLNKQFASRVRDKTQKDLQNEATNAVSTASLSQAREELMQIINTPSQKSN